MEDISSKMVDYVVMKIEDYHLPSKFYNTIIQSNDDTTVIRSNLFDMDDISQWVNEFSELTNTHWNTRDSCPHGERFVCWKKFICHHSSFMKVPVTIKRSKSFSCEATLFIKIKLNNSKTRYSDSFIKVGQCAIIVIRNKHSHNLWAGEALSFLPSSKSTRERFVQYFENGLGISESCHYHRSVLKSEGFSELELVNGRINPSQRTVRYWYDQWRESNADFMNEIENMLEKFNDTTEGTLNSIEEEVGNVDVSLKTENSNSIFQEILNSTNDVVESDVMENHLASSCLKMSKPYLLDFRRKKRKQHDSQEISYLNDLNVKISEQLEVSNNLKSQIIKEMRTENFLKLKKLKFTCLVKNVGLGCIYSC